MADQGSEGALSPWLRRKRFEAVQPYLKGRILDFGAGSGLLATLVPAEKYCGVEKDDESLQAARSRFPKHCFVSALPNSAYKFDTIVALAVIEHVGNPVNFLWSLAVHLANEAGSCLVITTPHPAVDRIHKMGSRVGLFSRHASEEHAALLDYSKLQIAGKEAGLKLTTYYRFLFGMNQLCIYARDYS